MEEVPLVQLTPAQRAESLLTKYLGEEAAKQYRRHRALRLRSPKTGITYTVRVSVTHWKSLVSEGSLCIYAYREYPIADRLLSLVFHLAADERDYARRAGLANGFRHPLSHRGENLQPVAPWHPREGVIQW